MFRRLFRSQAPTAEQVAAVLLPQVLEHVRRDMAERVDHAVAIGSVNLVSAQELAFALANCEPNDQVIQLVREIVDEVRSGAIYSGVPAALQPTTPQPPE